jgi:hypothetical protein
VNSEKDEFKETENFQTSLLKLLHTIEKADVETYRQLVSKQVTCFEPETGGAQVKGRDIHLFFVTNSTAPDQYFFEIIDPTLKAYGDTAFAEYTFLLTEISCGETTSRRNNVTRIFHRVQGV